MESTGIRWFTPGLGSTARKLRPHRSCRISFVKGNPMSLPQTHSGVPGAAPSLSREPAGGNWRNFKTCLAAARRPVPSSPRAMIARAEGLQPGLAPACWGRDTSGPGLACHFKAPSGRSDSHSTRTTYRPGQDLAAACPFPQRLSSGLGNPTKPSLRLPPLLSRNISRRRDMLNAASTWTSTSNLARQLQIQGLG